MFGFSSVPACGRAAFQERKAPARPRGGGRTGNRPGRTAPAVEVPPESGAGTGEAPCSGEAQEADEPVLGRMGL